MGAIWADGDLAAMPVRADNAILFAPVGHLVPPTLEVLRKGGTLAEAVDAGVTPEVTTYALAEANRALIDMKQSKIDGTGVLVVD